MNEQKRAYLGIHFCVLIWGFTAILGAVISLQALPLVWWRVFLCCLAISLFFPIRKIKEIDAKTMRQLVLIGVLVGIHWLCFYGAIKMANASVAVVTMAFTSFFAALLEPLFFNVPLKKHELALGIGIIPGMILIVQHIEIGMVLGFLVGILSALLAAIFSILNKKMVTQTQVSPMLISFVEFLTIVVMLGLFMPVLFLMNDAAVFFPAKKDWLWLLILAFGCTLLPFWLSLKCLKHLSAFSTNLILNLEPVYGVLLAAVLLHEHQQLDTGFYFGVLIILVSVFLHPFLSRKFGKN